MLVNLVADFYRRCKTDIQTYQLGFTYFTEEKLRQMMRSIEMIDYVVSTLDRESQVIIKHVLNNDDENDKYWFLDIYSERTYYRRRVKAFNSFVEGLKR